MGQIKVNIYNWQDRLLAVFIITKVGDECWFGCHFQKDWYISEIREHECILQKLRSRENRKLYLYVFFKRWHAASHSCQIYGQFVANQNKDRKVICTFWLHDGTDAIRLGLDFLSLRTFSIGQESLFKVMDFNNTKMDRILTVQK